MIPRRLKSHASDLFRLLTPAWFVLATLCLLAVVPASAAGPSQKPRVLVLTDIGNEPDDAMSMVRFLLYSNEFDVEGLIATTSIWQPDKVQPQLIHERVEAYAKVRSNLLAHAPGYAEAAYLLSRIKSGCGAYGLAAVGEGKDSEASEWIISVVDKPDPRPVWVLAWGGAVDLAQALWKVKKTRSPSAVKTFVKKLRVFTISDQDDTGAWMRATFPNLFYICSVHAFSRYGRATWTGISGERWYGFKGPDTSLVTNEWLDEHVRKYGPLGALYPRFQFIMEGDTPSFLYLIPNGLGVPEEPSYGSWGGRYEKASAFGGLYTDTLDTFRGVDGETYTNSQATVWRWREAYQNDFAGRMLWTVQSEFKEANHNPVVVLNGEEGKDPVQITVKPRETVELSAAGTRDPDGNDLTYQWFQYTEVSGLHPPTIKLSKTSGPETSFQAPAIPPGRLAGLPFWNGTIHVVLVVKDNGTPSLFAYRRAIVRVTPKP
jgi:Cellulose-binding Sde182, nucleoside hydrolase-like domain/Cellulose-binding protein Sde0182, C-terminal domain